MNRRELVLSLTAATVGAAGLMTAFGPHPLNAPLPAGGVARAEMRESAASLAAPSHLAVGSPTSTSLRLTWRDNSSGETGQRIERSTNGGPFVQIITISRNTTAFTITGLSPGVPYRFRIRAFISGVANSPYSNIAGGTTLTVSTATATGSPVPPTDTPTLEPTWTSTPSPSATLTSTATPTPTSTAPSTPTPTPTATATPTATSANTPSPSSSPTTGPPSGEPMPLVAPPGWTRVFSEDFLEPTGGWTGCAASGPKRCSGLLGTSYYDKWWAYPSPWDDTSNNGIYSPHLVLSVHDGVLDKFIHTTADGIHRVAAIAPQFAPHENLRITYRFRIAEPIVGYKAAWLTWPDQVGPISGHKWPENGELDCPEIHFQAISELHCYMHKQNATSGGDQYHAHKAVAVVGPWHTVTTEWIDGVSVKFFHNGVQFGSTTDRVPNTPHSVIAQTETQISSVEPDDAVSGHVKIDWVTIDTLAGS